MKFIVFLSVFHVLACSSAGSAEKIAVTVGIAPVGYMVEQVAGERVDVTVMLPSDADPHTYEPMPGQLISLSKASLYVACGAPFEEAWLDRILEKLRVPKEILSLGRLSQNADREPQDDHERRSNSPDSIHGCTSSETSWRIITRTETEQVHSLWTGSKQRFCVLCDLCVDLLPWGSGWL